MSTEEKILLLLQKAFRALQEVFPSEGDLIVGTGNLDYEDLYEEIEEVLTEVSDGVEKTEDGDFEGKFS